MEVDPVRLVYVVAAESMDLMTILRVVSHLTLLSVDYILSEVHLVKISLAIEANMKLGSWHEDRLL